MLSVSIDHCASLEMGWLKTGVIRARSGRFFQAVATKVNGDSCVIYLGPRAAGQFVKMLHNGTEYGVMELIIEAYYLMKRGLGLNNNVIREAHASGRADGLNGYLVKIIGPIFSNQDEQTDAKGSFHTEWEPG